MMPVESAWVAIGADPALELAYQESKKRMHGNNASFLLLSLREK
jgi:hypothetical protein